MSIQNVTVGQVTEKVTSSTHNILTDPIGFIIGSFIWLFSKGWWWILGGGFFFGAYHIFGEPMWVSYTTNTELTLQPNFLIYLISLLMSIGGSIFIFIMIYFIFGMFTRNFLIKAGSGAIGIILLWIFIQFPLVEFNKEVKLFSYALQMMQQETGKFALIVLSVVFSLGVIFFVFFAFTWFAVALWKLISTHKEPHHVDISIAKPYALVFMSMWVTTYFFQREYTIVMFPLFVIGFLLQKALSGRKDESEWEYDFTEKITDKFGKKFDFQNREPKSKLYIALGVIFILLVVVLIATFIIK